MRVSMIASSREYHAAWAGVDATARHRTQPTRAENRFIDPPGSGREEVDRLGRGCGTDLFRLEAEQHHTRDDRALQRRIVQLARDHAAPRHHAARSDGEL